MLFDLSHALTLAKLSTIEKLATALMKIFIPIKNKATHQVILRHCPSKNSAIEFAIWVCLSMPIKNGSTNF